MKVLASFRNVIKSAGRNQCSQVTVALSFMLIIGFSAAFASDEPGTAPSGVSATPEDASSLDPIATEVGRISLSIDGMGTLGSPGIIQVEKPAGATVRKAYFFSATTGFTGHTLNPGDVKIDGVDVVWDFSLANSISSFNYYADVTGMVSAKLNAAPAGRVDFEITEINSLDIDGEVLAVIFNDPSLARDVTVIILFGAQSVAGDQFIIGLAEPLDLSDPSTFVHMSLGISYGYQVPDHQVQFSLVDVNGIRLTSSAGGQDDCQGDSGNGALLTVGGLDDDPANPPDPYAPPANYDYDDELYDLKPFVSEGDLQIIVDTQNPSYDDNIFFCAFHLSAPAIIGEGCVLTPTEATNPAGTEHTVTATLQDEFANPIAGRQINFRVAAGPHAGVADSDITDANGKALFTYTGTLIGVDTIEADFINSAGELQMAENVATKEWTEEGAIPTLTEWGLIIFGVVLLGFITYVFLRRRKAGVSLP